MNLLLCDYIVDEGVAMDGKKRYSCRYVIYEKVKRCL